MKGRKNSRTKKLKKQVKLHLDTDVIEYFRGMSVETDIPYRELIGMYLRDCAESHRKLKTSRDSLIWGQTLQEHLTMLACGQMFRKRDVTRHPFHTAQAVVSEEDR
jgi:hypothetical protein